MDPHLTVGGEGKIETFHRQTELGERHGRDRNVTTFHPIHFEVIGISMVPQIDGALNLDVKGPLSKVGNVVGRGATYRGGTERWLGE